MVVYNLLQQICILKSVYHERVRLLRVLTIHLILTWSWTLKQREEEVNSRLLQWLNRWQQQKLRMQHVPSMSMMSHILMEFATMESKYSRHTRTSMCIPSMMRGLPIANQQRMSPVCSLHQQIKARITARRDSECSQRVVSRSAGQQVEQCGLLQLCASFTMGCGKCRWRTALAILLRLDG